MTERELSAYMNSAAALSFVEPSTLSRPLLPSSMGQIKQVRRRKILRKAIKDALELTEHEDFDFGKL
jgi:hypothetical protein